MLHALGTNFKKRFTTRMTSSTGRTIGRALGTHLQTQMKYMRDAYNSLCNKVPCNKSTVGGGVTFGYPAYTVVPPGLVPVPWVGMAEASAALTVSFRPVTPVTGYTSWAAPNHLMYMCFPHAPHAQHVVLLHAMRTQRRLAKRFRACTVGTAAVGVVLLNLRRQSTATCGCPIGIPKWWSWRPPTVMPWRWQRHS